MMAGREAAVGRRVAGGAWGRVGGERRRCVMVVREGAVVGSPV